MTQTIGNAFLYVERVEREHFPSANAFLFMERVSEWKIKILYA